MWDAAPGGVIGVFSPDPPLVPLPRAGDYVSRAPGVVSLYYIYITIVYKVRGIRDKERLRPAATGSFMPPGN